MDKRLSALVEKARRIVIFGGAGVSCESGIPDFRSQDGLYNQQYAYSPEEILSHHFFMQNPEEFYRFYRDKMLYPKAKPNAAHLKLAQWEEQGKLRAVITQNIDGLHQMAGSRRVYELHGSVHRNRCMKCGKFYGLETILSTQGVPRCECGGMIKPEVVLYEEALDQSVIEQAVNALMEADLLMVGGTSLNVYPAAGLLRYFSGEHLVVLNKTPTSADRRASLVIQEPIAEVLGS